MQVICFPSGPFATNAYLLVCEETKEAVIVDPSPGSFSPISAYAKNHNLLVKAIFLTHSHWDHIADAAQLKKYFNALVYVHFADAPNLRQPGTDRLPCPTEIEGVEPDYLLHDGDSLHFGKQVLEVLETPGHTPGGVCFYNKKAAILLSGDTLFKQSIGNLSFPTAEPEKMWLSLDRLAALPPETEVFPGHGDATTIAHEKWLARARKIFGP